MKYAIIALLLVAACVTAPKEIPYEGAIDWPAAHEFCVRHTNAAKTDPAYIADICIIECELRPSQSWCEDLNEIVANDQRRTQTNPD